MSIKIKILYSILGAVLLTVIFAAWADYVNYNMGYPLRLIMDFALLLGYLASGNVHQPNGFVSWLSPLIIFFVLCFFCFQVMGWVQKKKLAKDNRESQKA